MFIVKSKEKQQNGSKLILPVSGLAIARANPLTRSAFVSSSMFRKPTLTPYPNTQLQLRT
jgi:hypothetical protein